MLQINKLFLLAYNVMTREKIENRVLVLVALEEEFEVFIKTFPISLVSDTSVESVIAGELESLDGTRRLKLYAHCIADMTSLRSLDAAKDYISLLKPDLVVNIGIAGSLQNRGIQLGDVIIPTLCHEVEHRGKVSDDGLVVYGGASTETSKSLEEQYSLYIHSPAKALHNPWKLLKGPIATTTSVIESEVGKEKILGINRNFLAVEMEAYGVGRACHDTKPQPMFWAFKGVSDAADRFKSSLEVRTSGQIREIAMANATAVFAHFVSKFYSIQFPQDSEKTQGLKLFDSNITKSWSLSASRVVDLLKRSGSISASCRKFLNQILDGSNIDSVMDSVKNGIRLSSTLGVYGNAGYGVSTILSAIFLYAIEDGFVAQFFSLEDFSLESEFNSHSLEIRLDAQLLIVDGCDDRIPGRSRALEALQERLETTSACLLYGYRTEGVDEIFVTSIASKFPLKSLDTQWLLNNREIVDVFFLEPASDRLWAYLASNASPPEIDVSQLRSLYVVGDHTERSLALTLLVSRFNRFRIRLQRKRQENIIRKATKIAYAYFRKIEEADDDDAASTDLENQETVSTNRALSSELAFCHGTVTEYLVASHVIEQFLLWRTPSQYKNAEIPHVFPQRINRFCKQILVSDPEKQGAMVEAVRNVLSSQLHPYMKAHGCYLLGRISEPQLKGEAIAILEQVVCDKMYENSCDKPLMMISRSAYISLTYLGVYNRTTEYIQALFRNEAWDILNRGFHLEYYGDRTYDPKRPLESMDDLGPWPLTFDKLTERISNTGLLQERLVDIYTLFSLAYERFRAGRLSQKNSEVLAQIGNSITGNLKNFEDLLLFVDKCTKCFSTGVDPDLVLFSERYSLQFQKRVGYSSRGVLFGQSIADHIDGTVAISEHFLRESYSDFPDFDKANVIRILRAHDLGEGRCGDYLPWDPKLHEKQAEEASFFQDLRVIRGQHPSYLEYAKSWSQYRTADSVNAKVARDIDKIENILCLKVYATWGFKPKDFDEWIDALIGKLTPIGREVYQEITRCEKGFLEILNKRMHQLQPEICTFWEENTVKIGEQRLQNTEGYFEE